MSDQAALRRNSPVMIAVRLVESVAVIVPLAFAWFSIRTRWPTWFGVSVDTIVLACAVLALAGLAFEWWFTRFSVDSAGVTYRKGLLVRRAVSLGWDEVVSIQVSRSAVARALGCSKIVVGVGSESRTRLVIEAVTPETASEFEQTFARSRSRGQDCRKGAQPALTAPEAGVGPGSGDDPDDTDDARLLYRIRSRDFLVLSVTYGQFVLLVPVLFGLYGNVGDVLSLSDTPLALPQFTLPPLLLILGMLLVALPASVAFGVAVAWLRFRRFEVHRRAGVYTMTGGLLSAESRQVSRSQVEGLKVQQNPAMRVAGFARLRFVSRQSGDRIASNIVFPSVRLSSVRQDLVSQFPRHAAALDRPSPVPRPVGWFLGLINLVVLALVVAGARGASPVLTAVLVLATTTLLLVVTNYCWAAASIDVHGFISYRRGFVWVTHYAFPCESVYFVESYSVSRYGGPSISLLCLGIYDSHTVRLWVPIGESVVLDRILTASKAR